MTFQDVFSNPTYTHSQSNVATADRTRRVEARLTAPLRVAAVVQSQVVPRWIADLILDLDAAPFVDLAIVEVGTSGDPPSPSLFRAYEQMDRRLFVSEPDALEEVALESVAARLDATASVEPATSLSTFLETSRPDVVLNLANLTARVVAPGARYGAWRLLAHSPERANGGPTAFDELRTREEVVGSALLAEQGDGAARVLQRSYAAVDLVSLQRTRNRLLWKSAQFIPRSLEALHRHGWPYLGEAAQTVSLRDDTPAEPSSGEVLRHVFSTACGVAGRRLRRLFWRDEWFVAIRRRNDGDVERRVAGDAPPTDFRPILVSRDAYAADPFLFEHHGRSYLFFERFSYRDQRGSIWCCALDADGRPGTLIPVLDIGSHISYPYVFESGGEVYLVPESEEAACVALYAATDFPAGWRRRAVLFDNVLAVDPAIVQKDGLFWLFVNIRVDGASEDDELHLFFSPALDGEWRPHPQNPIVSDVRRARCAGRIFELNGALIRPSQDCARTYGHAVTFNRIDVLTPTDYSETAVSRMGPTWARGLSATHSYGFDSRFEVVDGSRPRRRVAPPTDRERG